MAFAQITLFPGRTIEQKRRLVEEVSQALINSGSGPDKVFVILNEVPPANWGIQGLYAFDHPEIPDKYKEAPEDRI